MTASDRIDLSVIVIAYNEELNLARCFSSLPVGVELIVLDSASTDRTVEIARSFGAQVHQRAFTHFAEQKNACLALATRSWVLAVDADEELSPELRKAISTLIQQGPQASGYTLQRRLVFMGHRMRFGKTQDQPLRLFKRAGAAYVGSIHEEVQVAGEVQKLTGGVLWHYSYRDLSDYFQRFNRYTTAIAERHAKEGHSFHFFGHILRPWIEFVNRYVFRLGFLDGYPGYTYALISSLYAYVKYAKLLEIKRRS